MVKHCCYAGCNSNSKRHDVKFVPFVKPTANLQRCRRWIHLCGRDSKIFNYSKITKVSYPSYIFLNQNLFREICFCFENQKRQKMKFIFIKKPICSNVNQILQFQDWCIIFDRITFYFIIDVCIMKNVGLLQLPLILNNLSLFLYHLGHLHLPNSFS